MKVLNLRTFLFKFRQSEEKQVSQLERILTSKEGKKKTKIKIMKWNATSFLENRLFDRRLVKENLLDKWNIYGDIYKTRTDYRQFLESYVNKINY